MSKRFHYRYHYRSLFGQEFSDFYADNDDEARLTFWENRNPELYQILMVEKSTIDEQADDDAYGCDDSRPGGLPDGAEGHLPQEVLPGRCDAEVAPVVDDVFGPGLMNGHPGSRGVAQRIVDLVKLLVRKRD